MAISCDRFRANLARQTPVYSDVFLNDFISDKVNAPYLGRHMTKQWTAENDRILFDKVHVPQPDLTATWQVINAQECDNPCNPPNSFVNWGTTRDSAFMEQITLRSMGMCMQTMIRIPHIGQQMQKIFKNIRQIPLAFSGDFVRTRLVSYHDTLQICGSTFSTVAITTANTAANCVTINLGSSANLPTSQLNWTYLKYLAQQLGLRGYSMESGLPDSIYNLVTHSLTWQNLTTQNPEVKALLALKDFGDVSPIYKIGKGISAETFGCISPTFDEQQMRFQHLGSGVLNRVLPYRNDPATTGEKPVVNPSWLNARYAISTFLHPKASVLYTPPGAKISEMFPTVSAAMYGKWVFINDNPIIWYNPDGTTCTKNNDLKYLFYWVCPLELGFQYDERDLVMPILHQIDGSGSACMIDTPVCSAVPQYVQQDYSDSPTVCDA